MAHTLLNQHSDPFGLVLCLTVSAARVEWQDGIRSRLMAIEICLDVAASMMAILWNSETSAECMVDRSIHMSTCWLWTSPV